jgi:hypothetical protein
MRPPRAPGRRSASARPTPTPRPTCRFDAESLATLKRSFVDMKLFDQPPDMSRLYSETFLPGGPAP